MAETNINALKHLLIYVDTAHTESFKAKYATAGESRDTSYDNKIVFIEGTNEIFTHGLVFGAGKALSDKVASLEESVASLNDSAKAIVKHETILETIATQLADAEIEGKPVWNEDPTQTGKNIVNALLALAQTDAKAKADQALADAKEYADANAAYDIVYDSNSKQIYLNNKSGNKLGSGFDATAFIKDGMLESANVVTITPDTDWSQETGEKPADGTYIKLVWNTDANKTATYVPADSLVDTYTAGDGLVLDDHVFSVKLSSSSDADTYLTIDENGALKLSGVKNYIDDEVAKNKALIDALRTDVNTAASDILTLQGGLEAASTDVEKLNADVYGIEASEGVERVVGIKEQVATNKSDIAALKSRVDILAPTNPEEGAISSITTTTSDYVKLSRNAAEVTVDADVNAICNYYIDNAWHNYTEETV